MQSRLAYWATYYKGIYDLPSWERPADDVLTDDDALDRWFEQRMREMDREARDIQRNRRK